MNTKTLRVPPQLTRAARVEGSEDNMRVSISSDTPYLRYDWWNDQSYYEVLDHGPDGFDAERLKAGLPILFNHDRDCHLGRATGWECDGHKLTVSGIKFSASAEAQERVADIRNGVLVDTSVGYEVSEDAEQIGMKDGIPVLRFKFKPYEGSFVTIPADCSVGAGRSREAENRDFREVRISEKSNLTNNQGELTSHQPNQPMPTFIDATEIEQPSGARSAELETPATEVTPEPPAPATNEPETTAEVTPTVPPVADETRNEADAIGEALQAERKRIADILAYVRNFRVQAMRGTVEKLGNDAITNGTTLQALRLQILESWTEPVALTAVAEPTQGSISRKQFEALSPLQQSNFCRAGGKITD